MKKGKLLRVLHAMGCVFVEHGKKHDVYKNPRTGKTERVPRHPDINEKLAKMIIKNLSEP
jgi:predicted RNA binding protein YcfA (HicA-like mRNA interferase family)